MMVFSMPSTKASERVHVWRKLQKIGCVSFRNAGYLLPNSVENRERLIWIAQTVRSNEGVASVLELGSIDDLKEKAVREIFRTARDADYIALDRELEKLQPHSGPPSKDLLRLRKRFDEIVMIDFFEGKQRAGVKARLDHLNQALDAQVPVKLEDREAFQNRTWVTRHRPGIDRISSAWLIARFIDPRARFVFAETPEAQPAAIPFDMYGTSGFSHQGDLCTFEILRLVFGVQDKCVASIAEAVHDADLEDRKYGREGGHTIQSVLRGWATQGLEDAELLKRGMELMDGYYGSMQQEATSSPKAHP
jgi:hypothetical protein